MGAAKQQRGDRAIRQQIDTEQKGRTYSEREYFFMQCENERLRRALDVAETRIINLEHDLERSKAQTERVRANLDVTRDELSTQQRQTARHKSSAEFFATLSAKHQQKYARIDRAMRHALTPEQFHAAMDATADA